jgi:hypothetical protein
MLESLVIDIGAFHPRATPVIAFQLQGHGSTPYDRVSSMQAQLAAFSATPNFLLPACWSSHTCLTAINICSMDLLPEGSMLRSTPLPVLRLPSLQELRIHLPGHPVLLSAEEQCLLSRLTRLTTLEISTSANMDIGGGMKTLWESIGTLPALKALGSRLHGGHSKPSAATPFTIPATWTALSGLSSLKLRHPACSTNPEALTHLTSLQSLDMTYTAEQLPQVMRCCAQLPALTTLTLHGVTRLHQGGAQPAVGAGQLAAGARSSCSPLKFLELSDYSMAEAPLQLFPGVSKLVLWGNWCKDVALPGGAVKPLTSLRGLKHLEMHCFSDTLELCW